MYISSAFVVLGVATTGLAQEHNRDQLKVTHRRRSLITPTTPLRRQSNLGKDIYRTFQDLFRARRDSNLLHSRDQHVLDSGEKLYCVVPQLAAASTSSSPSSTNTPTLLGSSSLAISTTAATAPSSSSTSGTAGSSSDDSDSSSPTSASPTTSTTITSQIRTTPISSTASSTSSPPPPPSPSWKVAQSYSGTDFFNKWNFFVGDDPTFGQVSYVDSGTAQAQGLAHVNQAGNFVMSVETTGTVSSKRQSIRITSQASYTQGLVVLDALHMPTGCGTWPAFWSNGPGVWPDGGEIDIVENVNDISVNQMTLHTSAGCFLPSADSNVLGQTGQVINGYTVCGDDSRVGCAVRSSDPRSFGSGFNAAGGGTYAMRWDNSGIAVWFWPSGSVPGDLSGGSPNPDGWGLPVARFATGACDFSQHFGPQSMIFDTTLCGQWGSPSWTQAGLTGQEQSCAQRTGFGTCEDFVRANGGALAQAYWEVRSVKLYQWST